MALAAGRNHPPGTADTSSPRSKVRTMNEQAVLVLVSVIFVAILALISYEESRHQ